MDVHLPHLSDVQMDFVPLPTLNALELDIAQIMLDHLDALTEHVLKVSQPVVEHIEPS